mmetsp:Transcript_7640/g.6765  ORF Transcript_7640/g.6765 Transcript_7640/m.6765 type:complete len:382 (+) Transcript_7640:1-1146(+)|eukprot:CAMPEP_0205821900 /NCGR_PEP_ID=MMETSP0206-20130828/10057_1 /ASSEMBLY_ACC=CAM_ASM_000279 /TAXON_ID=36767 /ORGANISM="Euplotes focardii, Strain TN1" /LENGTH=381 /DNA_ID=CAMNT_0053117739 /DNA_START=1 /DNA_END=1146 /DNA_ORIENTATION=+
MEATSENKMVYRYLGDSGLKVSILSFGNWITGHEADAEKSQIECIKRAYELGVNFFDTAEIYGEGQAETIMGKAIKELPCERKDLVISTKIFSCGSGINETFLSRKHITEAVHNSLKRLDLEYVDILFCHRPDDETPLEETIRAMNWAIEEGYAFYWATSEWSPERISQAMEICSRLKLIRPIADQCEYSALMRNNFEKNLRHSYESYKYGTTIWSPLAGGILTGKYNDGTIPEGTRYTDNAFAKNVVLSKYFGPKTKENTVRILQGFQEIADELKVSMAQLGLAWCIVNQDVSTCIFGATKIYQVEDNMKALDLAQSWTKDLETRLNELLGNEPAPDRDFNKWAPKAPRRGIRVDYNIAPVSVPLIFEMFQESTLNPDKK